MKLQILDVEKFVSVNGLRQVTDSIYLERDGTPTESGLFSLSIFGRPGSDDRRQRWAYVDLQQRFLHPLVYKTCSQLDRRFTEVVAGQRYVEASPQGGLVDSPESGWTGIAGLYENWDKIRWSRPGDTGQRLERVDLLRAVSKGLSFVTKWPVIPAIFRDIDTGAAAGGVIREVPPMNDVYRTLITTAPPRDSGLFLIDGARQKRAQDALLELHESLLRLIASKNGLIQDKLLGKYADYAVQGVLSGPTLASAERPGEQEVPFGSIGVPLYLVMNLFQPFIIKELDELMRPIKAGQQRLTVNKAAPGEPPRYEEVELPAEAIESVGPDAYRKWISRFMRDQKNRLDPVELELPSGAMLRLPVFDFYLGRETTLTDLFFIVASLATDNKHVLFTRYPIEHFQSVSFAKARITTTERTEVRKIGERTHNFYPVIDGGRAQWVDSIRLNNAYTEALGADYDGDRIRLFGLFTQEANDEAERIIRSAKNVAESIAGASRVVKNEGNLTLYSLTR